MTLGIALFPSDRAQESFLKVTQVEKREEKKAQVETGKNEPEDWRGHSWRDQLMVTSTILKSTLSSMVSNM